MRIIGFYVLVGYDFTVLENRNRDRVKCKHSFFTRLDHNNFPVFRHNYLHLIRYYKQRNNRNKIFRVF